MYYIVYGVLWLVSLLPWRILYLISGGIYVLIYYVFRYRREVVMSNLLIAFPEKEEKERRQIAKRFYHNLVDTFMETLKMLSASDRSIGRRFPANWEVVNAFHKSGRSVQIHIGHTFNWEWCNVTCPLNLESPFVAVYMPITNKLFERLFYKLRAQYGTRLLRATHMREDFAPYRDTQYVLALAADQSPGNPASSGWFNFFGRPTPFLMGPARGAIQNNTVVIFTYIKKLRRGYYEMVFTLAEDSPSGMTEIELTSRFVHFLEGIIRDYPDMWLWSHRRWKHEWKEGYGEVRGEGLNPC